MLSRFERRAIRSLAGMVFGDADREQERTMQLPPEVMMQMRRQNPADSHDPVPEVSTGYAVSCSFSYADEVTGRIPSVYPADAPMRLGDQLRADYLTFLGFIYLPRGEEPIRQVTMINELLGARMNPQQFMVIRQNKSMSPDIPNGSVCYVRRVTGKVIDYGRAYILDTVDGPVVKYLRPGSDDDHILCQSANSDPKFAPYEVEKSDILGMYRVVMCMKMM